MAVKPHKDCYTYCLPSVIWSLHQSRCHALYLFKDKSCIRGLTRLMTGAVVVGACLASKDLFAQEEHVVYSTNSCCTPTLAHPLILKGGKERLIKMACKS